MRFARAATPPAPASLSPVGWFRDVVPLTSATHAAAAALARVDGFAFHDALIVAAALEAGCSTLPERGHAA